MRLLALLILSACGCSIGPYNPTLLPPPADAADATVDAATDASADATDASATDAACDGAPCAE